MNNICLIGNVVKDNELSFMKNKDTAIMKFTLAVPKNMNRKESQFIPCVMFGKRAEGLSQYLVKGTKISVVGELQVNNSKQEDGSYKTYVSVVCSDIGLEGGNKKKESDPFDKEVNNNDFVEEPNYGEDLPF